jgi:O-antigen/teichoic acid export membrane protein
MRTVIYFAVLRGQISRRFSLAVLRPLVVLGIPVVFNSVATLVLRVSDRFFINGYLGKGEVALYQLADQFAAILPLLVSNPFSVVWPAMRYKVMKDEDAPEYYALVLTYLTYFSLYLGVGIAALAPDVIRVVAHEAYFGAAAVVPLFVVYYVLAATAKGVNVGLMLEKQAHWNAIVVIVSAALNLALNYLLIPRYGMYGAAYATIASFAFMNWFRWYMSMRYYPVAYEWGRILRLVAVAAALYAVASLVRLENPYLSFAARFAIAATYPLLVALVGFHDDRERARIAELWGSIRSRLRRKPGDVPPRATKIPE